MLLNASIVVNLALLLGIASAHTPTLKKQTWDDYAARLNDVRADPDDAKAAALKVIQGFSSRDKDFVPQLRPAGARLLFLTATGADSLRSYRAGRSGTATKFGSLIGQHLRSDDLVNASVDVCAIFAEAPQAIKDTVTIPDDCLNRFLDNMEKGQLHVSALSGIRSKWVSSDPSKVARALMGYAFHAREDSRPWANTLFQTLPAAAWEAGVNKSDDTQKTFCGQIHAGHLDSLTSAQRGAIGPACMASFVDLSTRDLKDLDQYSPDVFSLFNEELTQLTAFRLNEKQVASFSSRITDDDHCKGLNLAHLSPASAHAVTPKCLEGRISNDSSEIGKNLSLIPVASFSGWKDKSSLGLFHVKDWRRLNHKVLEGILKDGEILTKLPNLKEEVGLLNRNTAALITLNKTELKALADACPALASEIILGNVDLSGDSLAHFEIGNIEAMIALRDNDTVTGFDVFKIIVTQKNGRELILHMGDAADSHWCSSISDIQSYKDKPWLPANLSDKCRNELPFRNSPEAARQAPEVARKNEELVDEVLAEYDERRWASIEPGFFAALASSPNFCKALADPQHAKILEQLNPAALAMINAQCAVQMKSAITPTLAPKLGVNAFALMKYADMVSMKLSLKNLTPAQIPFVSAFLPPAEQSEGYFAKVDAPALEELDTIRFNAISSKQWGMVSAEVVKAIFTATRIPSMSPAVLNHLNDKQLEALDSKALAAFTHEQILELGKAVDAELKAFDKIKEQLDAVRANAIKARREALAAAKTANADTTTPPAAKDKDETATAKSGSNAIWWIVGCAIAVVIAAGIVFIIVRRN